MKKEKRKVGSRFKEEVALSRGRIFEENEYETNEHIAHLAAQTGGLMLLALVSLIIYVYGVRSGSGATDYLIAFIICPSLCLCLISSVFWVKIPKARNPKFKVFLIFNFYLAILVMNILFPKHGILGWAIVLVVAAQYYNPKFTRFAYFLSVAGILISIYGGMFFGEWDCNLFNAANESISVGGNIYKESDMSFSMRILYLQENPDRLWKVAAFYFTVRAITITIIYLLIRTLSRRTYSLLSNEAGEVAHREAQTTELNVAAGIQVAVLPKKFPSTPNGDIYALMDTAKEVGGDFYDFFYIDESRCGIVIADVSGKGVPAALYMMKTESLIKSIALTTKGGPADVIYAVNKAVCDGNDMNMFVTCWFGIIDFKNSKLTYTSAGHNAPLMKQNGAYSYIKGKVCLVLGAFPTAKYTQQEIFFEPGDKLFLYTDGVTEAHNLEKQLYGEPRLLDFLNEHKDCSCKETIEAVRADIDVFANGADQFDDITMIMAEFRGTKKEEIISKDFAAKKEENDEVCDFIAEKLMEWGADKKVVNSFKICAEEIFVNIAYYAYCGKEGNARIELSRSGDDVYLVLEDEGIEFNPLDKADPNIMAAAEERGIGGLGIFMVKKMMDQVTYKRVDGKNRLTLKKAIK